MYVSINLCMYVYICIHVYMYVCMYLCMYSCVCMYVCMCMSFSTIGTCYETLSCFIFIFNWKQHEQKLQIGEGIIFFLVLLPIEQHNFTFSFIIEATI